METKKYTTHPSFWWNIASILIWVFILSGYLFRKPIETVEIVGIILASLLLVNYLVQIIKCGLAWHSYMEISDEGVIMKECAKRISDNKEETINDIFIPWKDIEEIKNGSASTDLILKTGEKIKLTQEIYISVRTLRNALEQYNSKQIHNESELSPDDIISVISEVDDKDKL